MKLHALFFDGSLEKDLDLINVRLGSCKFHVPSASLLSKEGNFIGLESHLGGQDYETDRFLFVVPSFSGVSFEASWEVFDFAVWVVVVGLLVQKGLFSVLPQCIDGILFEQLFIDVAVPLVFDFILGKNAIVQDRIGCGSGKSNASMPLFEERRFSGNWRNSLCDCHWNCSAHDYIVVLLC